MLRTIGCVAAAFLVGAGAATAAGTETYKVSAKLNAGQEIPRQVVKAPNATGTFSGSYVEHGKTAKLTWKLTYSGLSGKATAAHIHLGKPGVAGNVLVALCAVHCRSGMTGSATITGSVVKALEAGKTYVNVHTAKNPGGEIRGQVKVKG